MLRLICPMSLLVVQKGSMPLLILNVLISLSCLIVYRLIIIPSAINALRTFNSMEDSVRILLYKIVSLENQLLNVCCVQITST